ncbi:thioesterase family protein [Carboxylicivirga sp. N1Y90]|uniref:thioesterase family protein n=1 Tax=Carboxylicivirga fragile TaxID=3417571 RepID=UPI003D3537D3|nr:hypothetical protein [Marinilabiliaceae bacterium N1Y90]
MKQAKNNSKFDLYIAKGIILEKNIVVEKKDLATTLGTGRVPYLSTAAMIVFMEQCCVELIEPNLINGVDSLSVEMNVKHFHPVAEGESIKCKAHLKFIDERKLFFDVAVLNSTGKSIGIGAHERYLIDHDEFLKKNSR